jgi:hypothetical protein
VPASQKRLIAHEEHPALKRVVLQRIGKAAETFHKKSSSGFLKMPQSNFPPAGTLLKPMTGIDFLLVISLRV